MQKFLVLIIVMLSVFPSRADDLCEKVLHGQGDASPLKPNDLKPRNELLGRLEAALEKQVAGQSHPLEKTSLSADEIGKVITQMSDAFPRLQELIATNHSFDLGRKLSLAQYVAFMRPVLNDLIRVAKQAQSPMEAFAALESLRLVSQLESQIEFPKTAEEIQKEEEKKKKEEKKEKEKQDQEEQEPDWNSTQDKYKPENKDVSQEDGGKKKTVDLVLTDVNSPKGLMRQKIYDQFDVNGWSSLPIGRTKVKLAQQAKYKQVINPLKSNSIDIPVPYGMGLKPKKTADYEIVEVGPGEYKLVNATQIVTLPLYEVIEEKHRAALASVPQAQLSLLPQHLKLFAETLQGLPVLEAAQRLEKYISLEGGFLYYSKGDKLDEATLKQLDQKLNSLMEAGLAKPIAMANVGAFNCDGAAWIGAIVLRDLLKMPVRIAGGRTLGGSKLVNNERMYVIQSSSDAHAWLEVYDGKRWVPFDMTPKNNVPDRSGDPSDLEQERDQDNPQDSPQDSSPSAKESGEEKGPSKDGEKKDLEEKEGKEEQKGEEDQKGKDGKKDKKDKEEKGEKGEGASEESGVKTEDLIKARSTQSSKIQENDLYGVMMAQYELLYIESLLKDGFKTKYLDEVRGFYDSLRGTMFEKRGNASWDRMNTLMNQMRFSKFSGLAEALQTVRANFNQSRLMDAKSGLDDLKKLFELLAKARPLHANELQALNRIDQIISLLLKIRHKDSKEMDVVQSLVKALPGGISKAWLKSVYGNEFDQLGSSGGVQMGQDLVKTNKLKPLLEVAAVAPFVDMTLDSTVEPQWKDQPTLNKSIMPKPRQDLVITRSPFDFARMLWSLRPGEPMFAPTIQGRQFAVGSLETRRVVDPKHPIERKMSVIYYDVSTSMQGNNIQVTDALLMAYVDKALSEVDAIGRPVHEIYLIPFNDQVLTGVHIATKEDAIAFFANKVNFATKPDGSTDIQKTILHFYQLIENSYKKKASAGREALFKKANMVLFTDGGSTIELEALKAARSEIPSEVNLNMNLVSIGDEPNSTLKELCESEGLSSGKPRYRELRNKDLEAIVSTQASFSDTAFMTDQKLSGTMKAQIDELMRGILFDPMTDADVAKMQQTLRKIGITQVSAKDLSGTSLRVALQLEKVMLSLKEANLTPQAKKRMVAKILEVYSQLSGRPLSELTYLEKETLEELFRWAL